MRKSWRHIRPDYRIEWLLRGAGLSRAFASYQIQRPRLGQEPDLPDQQYDLAAVDDCRAVQESLAGGIVLQVDQTAFAHQEISGHERKRRQDAHLVRRVDQCADRYCQERVATRCLALHFATDFIGVRFRKNPAISSLCRQHPT